MLLLSALLAAPRMRAGEGETIREHCSLALPLLSPLLALLPLCPRCCCMYATPGLLPNCYRTSVAMAV